MVTTARTEAVCAECGQVILAGAPQSGAPTAPLHASCAALVACGDRRRG